MNGHVRKRGDKWEVILELGEQEAQRCPVCVDSRGRSKRHWTDKGRLEACPTCDGELETITARRQIVLPDRHRTKKEAQARLTRELNAGLGGTFTEPAKLTVGEYLRDHWLPAVRGRLAPTTYLSYELHVTRIAAHIGSLPLQKLGTKDVDTLYARLASEKSPRRAKLSPTTCRAVHRVLHSALEKAVDWCLIPRNPADKAERPKPAKPQMKTWTREELTLFLSLTENDRLHPLWRTLAMTGMRRGEALALKWSDVDLQAGRIRVQRSRVQVGYVVREQGTTKTGRARVVAIDSGTVTVLRRQGQQQLDDAAEWGEACTDGGFIFTRENGEPWHPDRVTKLFDQAVKTAGVSRIRLHDLRHTHATLALQAGIHPKVVSERLGHAQVSMTLDTYSHAIPALQESAAELVAALVDTRA